MKVQILSDLHLECASFVPPLTSADVVILAGDIGVGERGLQWARDIFDAPVIYVPGNHEYHNPELSMSEHKIMMQDVVAGTHVHLLDNSVVVIDGVRVIGTTMWTDLMHAPSALHCDVDRIVVDYEAGRNADGLLHFSTDYAQSLFEANRRWLQTQLLTPFAGRTVVVTHHAPTQLSLHAQFVANAWNPCFMSDLEHLMGDSVALWVHGHTHNNFDYRVNGTRVVCNPRGYPHPFGGWENPRFDPTMIVEV